MVQSCCAINCTVRRNKDVKLKFLSIPKDPVRRKQWLVAIRRENFNPSARAVICENHFTKDDFELNVHGNRVLKKTSVPSVFNFPVHLEKKVLARRPLKRKITETEHLNTADDVTAGTSDTNTEVILEVSSNVVEYMDVDNEQTSEQTTSTSTSHQKEFSKRRRRDPVFFRDFHENDLNDEVKRIRFWKVAHNTIAKSRKLNRYYQCVTSRQKQKIKNLNLLLDELMKKENISSEQQLVLKLENDMENYIRWKLVGGLKFLKKGVVPHKFDCQEDRKRNFSSVPRPTAVKRKRLDMIGEVEEHLVVQDEPVYQTSELEDEVLDVVAASSDRSDKGIQVNIKPNHRSKYCQCNLHRHFVLNASCSLLQKPRLTNPVSIIARKVHKIAKISLCCSNNT